MAKISKKTVRLRDGEIDQHLEFTVLYNSEMGFWAEVPADYSENFDQLDEEQLSSFGGKKKYDRKYMSGDHPHKRIVTAGTEDNVVKAMQTLVLHLIKMTIAKVPVILIDFENRSEYADPMYKVIKDTRGRREKPDPNELPAVGLEFSATYCFQVSASGGKDRFYKYDEHGRRSEVSQGNWREKHTIIPDTPANRQFIEDLHKALYTLTEKMKEFTDTSDGMIKLIDSRQKLLSL